MATITDGQGVTSYAYDAVSNVASIVYPTGAAVAYAYDDLDRVMQIVNTHSDGTVLSQYDYIRDSSGLVTQEAYSTQAYYENNLIKDYAYDAKNQLIREKFTGGYGTVLYDYYYTYDAVGNRLEKRNDTKQSAYWSLPAPYDYVVRSKMNWEGYGFPFPWNPNHDMETVAVYVYDADNRLTEWQSSAHINNESFDMMKVTYDYDANGNRIKKEQFDLTGRDELHHSIVDYTYDYENRLIATERDYHHNVGSQCNEPGSCLLELPGYAYAYDGNGLRVSAEHDGSTRGFDYDGLDVVIEHDGAENVSASFTRGLGFSGGIGGVVGYTDHTDAQNPEHWNYHYDQLGSVGNLSNNGSDGKNVMIYYDAFGRQYPLGSKDAPYKQAFSSKEVEGFDYIEDTLVYFGARYYDPEVGRWLTKDPLGFVDGPNPYLYVSNDPVNMVDPYGFVGERKGFSPLDLFLDTALFGDSVKLWQASNDSGLNDYGLKFIASVGLLAGSIDAGFNVASLGVKGAAKKGAKVVIGHYPDYINLARKLDAKYFSVPAKIWNNMSVKQKWVANKKFLDRAIKNGKEIILSTPLNKVRSNSFLRKEIDYLMNRGIKFK